MPGKPWTVGEVGILEEHYPVLGTSACEMLPGRSRGAVGMKAAHLGLSCGTTQPLVGWLQDEIDVLCEWYPVEGSDVTCRLRGRSREAARQKAQDLGLPRPGLWTEEELSVLAEEYPKSGCKIPFLLERHNPPGIMTKASSLGIHVESDPVGALMRGYESGAAKRGIEFDLPRVLFEELIRGRCKYCGEDRRSERNGISYMGVDRVDNSMGYVPGNVVPCCKICNYAKGQMTLEQFKDWVRDLYQNIWGGNEREHSST